jgi:ribosomal protein S16
MLGWYDPKLEGENYKLDQERIDYWRSQGAQMSETVANLVRRGKRAAVQA